MLPTDREMLLEVGWGLGLIFAVIGVWDLVMTLYMPAETCSTPCSTRFEILFIHLFIWSGIAIAILYANCEWGEQLRVKMACGWYYRKLRAQWHASWRYLLLVISIMNYLFS
ncbi:unnamed protein product, partial [Mesorhabditis spiculigera]